MASIAARAALVDGGGESDYEKAADTERVRIVRRISVAGLVAAAVAVGLVLAFVGIAAAVGVTAAAAVGACVLLLAARFGRGTPTSPAVIFGLPQRHVR